MIKEVRSDSFPVSVTWATVSIKGTIMIMEAKTEAQSTYLDKAGKD